MLTIVVAWNFAVAQPLLDVLGRNATLFVAHDSPARDIVLLAVGLTVLAPLLLALVVAAVTVVWPPGGRTAHALVVGTLAVLMGGQVVERLGEAPIVALVPLLAAVAVVAVHLYRRWAPARTFVRYLSPAPLVFTAWFLFGSPVSALVVPGRTPAGALGPAGNPVPVVMVVFDELPVVSLMAPDGTIASEAYPNFARLASMSTWYRNTTTVASNTDHAVPALLTGRRPTYRAVPVARSYPRNLFSMLEGAYTPNIWEALTSRCSAEMCGSTSADVPFTERMGPLVADTWVVAGHTIFPSAVAGWFPSIDGKWSDFGASGRSPATPTGPQLFREAPGTSEALTEMQRLWAGASSDVATERKRLAWHDPHAAVRAFDAGLRPSRRPALHFLHIQHPHYPWRYLPDGRSYDAPSPLPPFDARWPAGETAALARSRHLLQVQDADRLLGEILDRLSATGLVDDALVVVTSDHGISFGAGLQPRGVTGVAQGDTAWVPLFVKVPGRQGGRIDDRPASILDVLPTVADVLEMPLDDPDGRSLLRSAGPVERAILAAGGEWLTLPPDAAPRDQALRRAYEEVGTDPRDGHRLFRIGRYGSLVGTVPPAAPTATSRAVLGDAPAFAGVDPRTGRIPAFVTLRIVGDDDTPSVSDGHVIAVNGVIAGTAHVQDRESGTVVVGGLVDPASFRTGRNEIALYAVTGPPSGPSFRRIPLAR